MLNTITVIPGIVYSQPADTGTGTDINTQIVYAVDHLKVNNFSKGILGISNNVISQHNGNPMRLQDLAIVTNTQLDSNTVLLEKFKAHDRVVYDAKTDLYSYRVRIRELLREDGSLLFNLAVSTTFPLGTKRRF